MILQNGRPQLSCFPFTKVDSNLAFRIQHSARATLKTFTSSSFPTIVIYLTDRWIFGHFLCTQHEFIHFDVVYKVQSTQRYIRYQIVSDCFHHNFRYHLWTTFTVNTLWLLLWLLTLILLLKYAFWIFEWIDNTSAIQDKLEIDQNSIALISVWIGRHKSFCFFSITFNWICRLLRALYCMWSKSILQNWDSFSFSFFFVKWGQMKRHTYIWNDKTTE